MPEAMLKLNIIKWILFWMVGLFFLYLRDRVKKLMIRK